MAASNGINVLPLVRRDLADAEGKTATNTYSPTGNLLTSTDPGGNVTTYVYNSHGQPTEIQKPGGAVQTLVHRGVPSIKRPDLSR